jgi:hypothetical protein
MRKVILALALFLAPVICTQAWAQTSLSISIGSRGVSLGFAISSYPTLQRIPGYPVYYDPQMDLNYFFYDGLYWVYMYDNWYSSPWYDGPWDMVYPAYVPLFVLRIPVRYYRRPPPYFRGWRPDAPPRWGEHWGRDWERQRSGWDRWNRRYVPAPAPLPTYQRAYSGSRYPRQQEQQRAIESRRYRYQPRESVSRQILQERRSGEEPRNRQPRQDHQRQRQDVQQPPSQRVRQEQDVRQQQEQRTRQRQDVGQPPSQRVRQEQDVRQQQEQRTRQRQDLGQPPPQRIRQEQDVRQQQEQRARQRQDVRQQQPPRSQSAPKARGTDSQGGKGRSDKDKGRKDDDQGRDGHP